MADVDGIVAVLEACALVDLSEPGDGGHDLLAHGLQTAALLRSTHPDDVELQVAGLVHDIGHVLAPGDDAGHGDIAAEVVAPVLGDRVADLVRLHVPAKRYLVTTERGYRALLDADSTMTLAAQGAEMSADELGAFRRQPHHDAALALRRADEGAKVAGLPVDPLQSWIAALERVSRS
jgi:predicted HD phosphohydrolase